MVTRSGRDFRARFIDRQRDELLEYFSQELQTLSSRVDDLEAWREPTSLNQAARENGGDADHQGVPNEDQDAENNVAAPIRAAPRPAPFNRNHQHNRAPIPDAYRQHTGPNDDYNDITKKVKVDVPDFSGKLDPHFFNDWIVAMEDYFEWYGMSEDRKVRFAKMKLKGQARMWWRGIEDRMSRLGLPPILHWEEMKMKLQERYLPLDYENSIYEELLQLKQGSMTVEEYTEKFNNLRVRRQLNEDDRQLLSRYKTGLRAAIRREVPTVRFFSIDEVYQMALKV